VVSVVMIFEYIRGVELGGVKCGLGHAGRSLLVVCDGQHRATNNATRKSRAG